MAEEESKAFSVSSRLSSFKYAFKGLVRLVRYEHNARIHITASIIVIWAGFYFKVTPAEWMWLVACIAAVIFAELVNTCIEKLVDKAWPGKHETAGAIKDMASAAVLVVAIAAAIIGLLIFWPKIF